MVEPSSVQQIVATLLSSIAATTTTLGGVVSVISSSLHVASVASDHALNICHEMSVANHLIG